MAYVDFSSTVHKSTKRDYLARVNSFPKAKAAELAKKWDYDYWDGSRDTGYGGFRYDGRWKPIAEKMAKHYNLTSGLKVLDVGCGKAFLLYELEQAVPGLKVTGLDISQYAIDNAKEEIKDKLVLGHAKELPFKDKEFDFALSLNTFHNLYTFELEAALKEIERVAKQKYLVVESYRNEEEKANLLYWQLTCEGFYTPEEWNWWFEKCGYTGDHSFIYFE